MDVTIVVRCPELGAKNITLYGNPIQGGIFGSQFRAPHNYRDAQFRVHPVWVPIQCLCNRFRVPFRVITLKWCLYRANRFRVLFSILGVAPVQGMFHPLRVISAYPGLANTQTGWVTPIQGKNISTVDWQMPKQGDGILPIQGDRHQPWIGEFPNRV